LFYLDSIIVLFSGEIFNTSWFEGRPRTTCQ
jgi:hypothetical protein